MAETITDPLAREVLRCLAAAHGPLTAEDVRSRLAEWHRMHLAYGDVYNRLVRLAALGLLESRADAFPGHGRARIFWPAA